VSRRNPRQGGNRSTNPPATKADNSDRSNQPARDYRAIVHALNSLKQEIAASNKSNNTSQQNALRWNKHMVIAAAGSNVLALLAVLLSKCSVDATRESYTAVQRAFVVSSGIKIEPKKDQDGAITGYELSPLIWNSGSTPTKDMRAVFIDPRQYRQNSYYGPPPDPDSFIITGPSSDPTTPKLSRYVIGPHDYLPPIARPFMLNRRTTQDILSGQLGSFYFGVIRYYDVFDGSPEHVTKFCYDLNSFVAGGAEGFSASGPGLAAPAVRPDFAICPHWNCADNECEDDKRRYDEEKARAPKNGAAAPESR
jgi:hypothetical protein